MQQSMVAEAGTTVVGADSPMPKVEENSSGPQLEDNGDSKIIDFTKRAREYSSGQLAGGESTPNQAAETPEYLDSLTTHVGEIDDTLKLLGENIHNYIKKQNPDLSPEDAAQQAQDKLANVIDGNVSPEEGLAEITGLPEDAKGNLKKLIEAIPNLMQGSSFSDLMDNFFGNGESRGGGFWGSRVGSENEQGEEYLGLLQFKVKFDDIKTFANALWQAYNEGQSPINKSKNFLSSQDQDKLKAIAAGESEDGYEEILVQFLEFVFQDEEQFVTRWSLFSKNIAESLSGKEGKKLKKEVAGFLANLLRPRKNLSDYLKPLYTKNKPAKAA